jgi:hypothetical protein
MNIKNDSGSKTPKKMDIRGVHDSVQINLG